VTGEHRRRIIALVGPTAVGKTEIAMALADRFPVSLISLDSAMVYRGMDVGTAKPEPELLQRYPHALIDIRDPAESYSAAEYLAAADAVVQASLDRGRTPLLVGGTMLYLKTFREGLAPLPSADPVIRGRLTREAETRGSEALHRRLMEVDPDAASRIHPNNFSRIQRALEVVELTGRPMSSFWGEGSGVAERLGAQLLEFGIDPGDRTALHERIAARFNAMLDQGFVEEVDELKRRGDLHPDLPSMRAVGYRQIWEYLEGGTDMDGMREKALAATRQLAKRQLTWMRSFPDLVRIQWGDKEGIAEQIGERADLANP
jgi:tRNA dimethylallyltransferase